MLVAPTDHGSLFFKTTKPGDSYTPHSTVTTHPFRYGSISMLWGSFGQLMRQ